HLSGREQETTAVAADGLDMIGDARGALALDVLVPERAHALHEAARRVDLEVLALPEQSAGMAHLVPRALCEVRRDGRAERGLAPDLRVGDRFPESLRGRADVDLEHLLHGGLQPLLDVAERRSP